MITESTFEQLGCLVEGFLCQSHIDGSIKAWDPIKREFACVTDIHPALLKGERRNQLGQPEELMNVVASG